MSDEPVFTDEEIETMRAWISGIERRIWKPTDATKDTLAGFLRRIVVAR